MRSARPDVVRGRVIRAVAAVAALALLLGPALLFGPAGQAAATPRVPPPAISTPAAGSTVSTARPQLAGTGVAGDSIIAGEQGLILCVATVREDGRWACTPTTSLKNGLHHLTATQTDRKGAMSGDSATLTLRVRAATPAGSTEPRAAHRNPSPSGAGKEGYVPLAIIAVLALAGVGAVAAFLRLRPRR